MSVTVPVRLPTRILRWVRARFTRFFGPAQPAVAPASAPPVALAQIAPAVAAPAVAAPTVAALASTPVALATATANLTAAPSTPASCSLSRSLFLQSLTRFQDELGDILAPLRARPPYVPRGRSRKWRAYMPKLARTCADTMEFSSLLFRHFSFQGQDLRNLEEEVRQIGLFLVFLGGAVKTVSGLYLMRKAELCDRTMEVVDQVQALSRMPALSKEEKELSRDAAALIEAVVEPSRQATRRKRRQDAAIRAEGEAQAAALEAELHVLEVEKHVLRGGSLTPEVVQQAADPSRQGGG